MLTLIKQERALIITSLFAVSLIFLRIFHLGGPCSEGLEMFYCPSMLFLFLIWNLILAWVPLCINYTLIKQSTSKWLAGISILVWLLFFPNAPYLITDLIHLRARAGIPLWYDAFILFIFAYLGIRLAITALQEIQIYLTASWGKKWSKSFVMITLLLSGLGIYLGRIERWNSWDLFTQPKALLKNIFDIFSNPASHSQAYLMMAVFFILMSLMYWMADKQKLSFTNEEIHRF